MDTNIDYIGQKYQWYFLIDINTSYVWLEKTKGTLLNLYLINKII
jgi:hypothetical protein